jgi:hypothetical protein
MIPYSISKGPASKYTNLLGSTTVKGTMIWVLYKHLVVGSHIIWYISAVKKVKTFFMANKVMLFCSPMVIEKDP